MDKSKFHLGQIVRYNNKEAVIDALTQSSVGLIVEGNYEVVSWELFVQD